MTASTSHRLEGLESDNLLAFLALLGLLRSLEAADKRQPEIETLRPRVAWDVDVPPLRPLLVLARPATQEEVSESAACGVEALAGAHNFGGQRDLNYSREECRRHLQQEARSACLGARERADLLAALMSDAAIKDDKKEPIDPTPLCLLFGQGHQHFLERLAVIPRTPAPATRSKGKTARSLSTSESLAESLFHPWHRSDPTFSFRWDPEEDVRYALLAGDPTDAAYKTRTQHGANRLAAVGLSTLTVVPEQRAGRVRPSIIGGAFGANGFSFAWPIWREPASLAAVRSLLVHPRLREPDALKHLGVVHILVTQRISVGNFMNFTRARPMNAL